MKKPSFVLTKDSHDRHWLVLDTVDCVWDELLPAIRIKEEFVGKFQALQGTDPEAEIADIYVNTGGCCYALFRAQDVEGADVRLTHVMDISYQQFICLAGKNSRKPVEKGIVWIFLSLLILPILVWGLLANLAFALSPNLDTASNRFAALASGCIFEILCFGIYIILRIMRENSIQSLSPIYKL